MGIDMTAIWEHNRMVMNRELQEKKNLEKEVNRILVSLNGEKNKKKNVKKNTEKTAA